MQIMSSMSSVRRVRCVPSRPPTQALLNPSVKSVLGVSRISFGSPIALFVVVLLVVAVMSFSRRAYAQSVVVSVPNTDVTPEGVAMLAHESQVNVWTYDEPYWNSFSFATYGVGRNIELAATLYGVGRPSTSNVTVALGYKHRVPLSKESPWEPAFAFGPMLPMSLSGKGVGVWTYLAASIRVPGVRTRFTIGPSYGTKQIFGGTSPTLAMLAAVEQPITKRVSLIADYFSGTHELAALVPALQINATRSFIVIAGVKIPNSPAAGPTSALVELTYEIGH